MHHQKVVLHVSKPKESKNFIQMYSKAVDEYLSLIEKCDKLKSHEQLLNPVWHVHRGFLQKRKLHAFLYVIKYCWL